MACAKGTGLWFPMEPSGEEADCSFAFSGSSGKVKRDVTVASTGWERGVGAGVGWQGAQL